MEKARKTKEEILSVLLRELEEGKYPVGSRFPSEYDLAIRFDVSRLTTNKAVAALVTAGRLSRGRRGAGTTVRQAELFPKGRLLYLGRMDHAFFSMILEGATAAAFARGYLVSAICPNVERLNGLLAKVNASDEFQGIVSCNYDCFDILCPRIPVIYVDMCDPSYHQEISYVASENEKGAFCIVEELHRRGYRDMVVYGGANDVNNNCHHRLQGYLKAFRKLGFVDAEKRLFLGTRSDRFDAAERLREMLAAFPHLDAIVTTTDNLSVRICDAMAEAGIPRPEKVLVTGYGNVTGLADGYRIPSVEQQPFHMGATACNLLLNHLEDEAAPWPVLQYVNTEPVNLHYAPVKA